MQKHPEWAARNPEGKIPSQAELLGDGVPYYINWMCPAQRPGYADQWLLPMIEEIVRDYDVDGIHHDYLRYPGDVAPDSYFFYTYRQDAINRFAREAWERASVIKPNIEFSAAVFKNPMASGRFIGQRWTDFSPWVDLMMPIGRLKPFEREAATASSSSTPEA